MSESRQCCYCHKHGTPPDVLPYLTENGPLWAHQDCHRKAFEARKYAEHKDNGDGV